MKYESNQHSSLHPNAHTEWRYVDAQDNNGWKIVSIFYPRIGINSPTVSTYINSPDGEESSSHQQSEADLKEGNIIISSQELNTDSLGVSLVLDTSKVKCQLQFTPEIKPQFIPINQGNMRWQIEIPRARVKGQLVKDGTSIAFSGRGYHDHNWFIHEDATDKMNNREILPYFLRGWQFGRLFSEELTMVYGFSQTESHFLLWEKDKLIRDDHARPFTTTEFSVSEKRGTNYPTRFNLTTLGIDCSVHLTGILSKKKLALFPDGTQTRYVRSKALIEDGRLGKLEGMHEVWL